MPDVAAATERAVTLGATLLLEKESWNTLSDPAGHPFDLCLNADDPKTTLMGVMLIYGAFNPQVRSFALIIAGASKLVFIALVLSHGGRYLDQQAGIAIAIDLLWVVLFAWYLLSTRATSA